MSRPILSRPRTRVYGCNYDKGESYYKPMVDHLDRKYSGRPLFSEPRTSLADEIAARRNDIGSRDLSRTPFGHEPDLDPETPTRTQLPSLDSFPEEEIVYDSLGQRRRRFADNFANDVISSTHRLKAKLASINLDDEVDAALGKFRRSEESLLTRRNLNDVKSISEEAEAAFKRRSRVFEDLERIEETKPSMVKWSKMLEEEEVPSSAASRAKLTKNRLNDLESEMEEMAERQAKRERRAAALRALINETANESENLQQQSLVSKKVSIRSSERSEKVAF